MESCTFTGNLAGYGGAVYSSNRSSLHVSNCNFTNNLAVHNGGAISNNGTACIGESPNGENCIFSGNAANDDGGAIYSSNDLTLYDSSFKTITPKTEEPSTMSKEAISMTASLKTILHQDMAEPPAMQWLRIPFSHTTMQKTPPTAATCTWE